MSVTAVLGDDVASDLALLREHAVSLMRDACRVERRTSEVFDEGTGQYVPTLSLVYAGPCRVQTTASMEANPATGGVEFTVHRVTLQLPVEAATAAVRIGDVVTVTAAESDEASLVGRRYSVTSDQSKTHAVMRRFACEEVAR